MSPRPQRNSRYDGQIAVFGAELQAKLGAQKYFVVSVPNVPTRVLVPCVVTCSSNVTKFPFVDLPSVTSPTPSVPQVSPGILRRFLIVPLCHLNVPKSVRVSRSVPSPRSLSHHVSPTCKATS